MSSPVPSNLISESQYQVLTKLIAQNDRVAFYVKLYDFTGSKTALAMAQIASSSGTIGGTAWAVNTAYEIALPGYPEGGVDDFSIEVAVADLQSIRPMEGRPGIYSVPNDQDMLVGAYRVWELKGLGGWFPGNGLIAANYLAAGNIEAALPFLAYAAGTAPVLGELFVGELWWEGANSSLNSGKSLTEYLATIPGATVHSNPTGDVQSVIGEDGRTIGAFPTSPWLNAPLTVVGAVREYADAFMTRAYELWDGALRTGGEILFPTFDAVRNMIGFSSAGGVELLSRTVDPADSDYRIEQFANGWTRRSFINFRDGTTIVPAESTETWTRLNEDGSQTVLHARLGAERLFTREDSIEGRVLRSETYRQMLDDVTGESAGYQYTARHGDVTVSSSKSGTSYSSSRSTVDVLSGDTVNSVYQQNADTTPVFYRERTIPLANGNAVVERYEGQELLNRREIEYFYDENGRSRIETVVMADGVYRYAYDTEGQQVSSSKISDQGLDAMRWARVAGVFNDVNALIGAIRSGHPIPILSGTLRLASTLDPSNGNLATVSGVAAGISSFYNLYNAMNNVCVRRSRVDGIRNAV